MIQIFKYLNGTCKDKMFLLADNLHVIKWNLYESYSVHPDFKSHTVWITAFEGGAKKYISRKKNLNNRSRTEAELVGANKASNIILWM